MQPDRQLQLTTLYAGVVTFCLILVTFMGVRSNSGAVSFDEITVKRINIVSEEGQERMVISNGERQHNGRIDGKDLAPRKRSPGLIFINEMGDECGGLVYRGGDSRGAYMLLSYDQFRNDQVMQLRYTEDTLTNDRQYGLQLWEFPVENSYAARSKRLAEISELSEREEKVAAYRELRSDGLLSQPRMFVGRTLDKEVGLFIQDAQGRPRIRIYVDTTDVPQLEFLDEEGNIVPK